MVSIALVGALVVTIAWRLAEGVGIFGLDQTAAWAVEIATLGFWLGLGLATALVAAVSARGGRDAERLAGGGYPPALAALACGALVAILHLGRPGLAHWLLPVPNQSDRWPQLGSPIAWASLAVVVAGALAVVATLRRRPLGRRLAGATAGACGLALALVGASSVPTASGALAGALFVLVFAAGAVVSALAAALAFTALRREDGVAAAMLPIAPLPLAGAVLGGLALLELVLAGAGRARGPLGWLFWLALAAAAGAPQLLRLAAVRASRAALAAVGLAAAAAVWLERLTALVGPLQRGALPAAWSRWTPTGWDAALAFGTLGLFLALAALLERAPAAREPAA